LSAAPPRLSAQDWCFTGAAQERSELLSCKKLFA
jgi:hypothetical protein